MSDEQASRRSFLGGGAAATMVFVLSACCGGSAGTAGTHDSGSTARHRRRQPVGPHPAEQEERGGMVWAARTMPASVGVRSG